MHDGENTQKKLEVGACEKSEKVMVQKRGEAVKIVKKVIGE